MLLALKFRGDIEPIRDTFAGRSLLALQEQAKERGRIFEFGKSGAAKFGGPYEETDSKWVNIGCIAALILAAALMIIGLATILHWIF
jgi:hypothetical protein